MLFPPPLGIHSLPQPYPPVSLRSRVSKPMKLFPKLISKPSSGSSRLAGTFKLPKNLTSRLRAWKIIPPPKIQGGSRRRRQNYDEKQLFGDDKDYTDEDEEDEEDGFVVVKQTCSTGGCSEIHQAGGCGGERRANTSAWEYGCRRMMF